MSETTIHNHLAQVLGDSGLFAAGSIVINDQGAVESKSRAYAPFALIETADGVAVNLPAADGMGIATYQPVIRLIHYAGGKGEKVVLDAFRDLRDGVIAALVANTNHLTAIATQGAIAPFGGQANGEADCIAQGLVLTINEYL